MTDVNSANSPVNIKICPDDILAKLHQLPTLTIVVREIIASFKNENTDSITLTSKISQDQGLSAKILRVANSPFYGLSRKVGTVQEAALVIGFNSIRNLALSAGFMLAFPHSQDNLFDRKSYWLHSFRVAGYTQALAKCLGHDQQLAFTIGMFHDIGLLVLDVCIPERFAGILAKQNASGLELTEIEQAELGFDHALVGAEMAKRWNFPQEIEQSIHYWRTPEHEPFGWSIDMVYVAVLLEKGLREDELINSLPAGLCDRLQLSWECIKNVLPDPEQLDIVAHQIIEG